MEKNEWESYKLLGLKMRDKVTGLEGIVLHVVITPHSADQVCIQPQDLNKDGAPKDVYFADVIQMELLTSTPILEVPPLPPAPFSWGEKVKSTMNGMEGRITGRALYLNGCARVSVQPPFHKDIQSDVARGYWFNEGELVSLETKKEKEQRTQAQVVKPQRGGPAPHMVMSNSRPPRF